jgi:hypothetical protein
MTTRAVEARRPRNLLSRILDPPNLAQVVQGLDPRVLHQLVRHCGLEDCGEIVAFATTEQMRIFDDDLWWSDKAGDEDQLDAERFGLWLELLTEVSVAATAQKLAEMDFDFVTAAISRHVLVLDVESILFGGAAAEMGDRDPLEAEREALSETALEDGLRHEISGYTVVAKRGESWDALLSVLMSLDEDHHAFFGRLMKRCCRISTEYIVDNGGL